MCEYLTFCFRFVALAGQKCARMMLTFTRNGVDLTVDGGASLARGRL